MNKESQREDTYFEQALAFYASYHHDNLNKLVHILFVWPIFFTAQIFLHNAPKPPSAIAALIPSFIPADWAMFASIYYGAYYFFVEQPGIVGPLASILVFFGYFYTKSLNDSYPESCWMFALGVHIFSWVAQILAHKYFEGRSPALLDNIRQALIMAPLFVLIEVFFLLGYKKDLQKKVDSIAVANIAEFRKSQEKSK